jgi:hypothetical protein
LGYIPLKGRKSSTIEQQMKIKLFLTAALFATLLIPACSQAQGTVRGAEEGAEQGGQAGGPVGAIVGGAVRTATGTVGGILGVDDRPRFREYVVRQHQPSYRYSEELRVGAVLPERGVTYYDVPAEYHAPGYRYTYD